MDSWKVRTAVGSVASAVAMVASYTPPHSWFDNVVAFSGGFIAALVVIDVLFMRKLEALIPPGGDE